MPEPIVFIGHHRVGEGQLENLRQFYREKVKSIEADLPGTLVDLAYVSKDGAEVTIFHLFPDADAMDPFFQGVGDRSKEGNKYLQPIALEVYGTPSANVLEILKQIEDRGVSVSINPQIVGGFVRLKPG